MRVGDAEGPWAQKLQAHVCTRACGCVEGCLCGSSVDIGVSALKTCSVCTDRLLCMRACHVWGMCMGISSQRNSQQAWEHVVRTHGGLYVEV